MTDLRVEGRRRCARTADKFHKEGPVLESEEEEEEEVAAAGARERRNGMWTRGEPSGGGAGDERKTKNKNKEGRRETRAHEENGGERDPPGKTISKCKSQAGLAPS